MKKLLPILGVIVLLGAGCSQSTSRLQSKGQNSASAKTNTQVYSDNELGFSLKIPPKWVDYKFYTERENSEGRTTVVFNADFEDWKKFELLRISKVDKAIWEEAARKCADQPKAGANTPQAEAAFDEWSQSCESAGEKLGEKGNFVFTYNAVREDVPKLYSDDGRVMPLLPGDFQTK